LSNFTADAHRVTHCHQPEILEFLKISLVPQVIEMILMMPFASRRMNRP